MTVLSTSVNKSKTIIDIIKNNDPNLPVIIGGPHCIMYPKKSIEETGADISFSGEGENIIVDIKKALQGKINFNEIPGVYYKNKTKNIIEKGLDFKPIKNLDSIPFPARHLVKKYLYGKAYNPKIKHGEFTSIITSRGCPFDCSFCSRKIINFNIFRTRSTENILKEIREINNDGFKYLAIEDDSFLSNNKQAHTIFDAIIDEQIKMKYYITASRADSADRKLYKKMKKAGVVSIQFGLESGNQEMLDYYNKKTTVEKMKRAVILSHNAGFFTSGTFILGAPNETKEYLEKTVRFAKSLPLDTVSFLPLRYRAGTKMWNDAVKEGKIVPNEYEVHADLNRGLGRFTKQELLNYCTRAQRSFYLRPKYIVNLFKSSLEKNDFTLLHNFFSVNYSAFKENIFHI